MRLVCIVSTLFFLSARFNSHARLDESFEQVKTRYGEPISSVPEKNAYFFEKSGFIFLFMFENNKVWNVCIWHPQRSKETKTSRFSKEMVMALIELYKDKNKKQTWVECKTVLQEYKNQGNRDALGVWSTEPDEERFAMWRIDQEDGEQMVIITFSKFLEKINEGILNKIRTL